MSTRWLERLTVGGLCCGYGGLELVTEQFGGRTRWMVENDPAARAVLRAHWPKVKLHRDLKTLDWARVQPVDVIVAGFPCQPVSQAGRQKGTADDRWLWPWIAEGVRHLAPRYVLLENVRGLLTANGGAAVAEVVGTLADLGFDAEWCCQTAAGVGACHRRERWFCVAKHSAADTDYERRDRSASQHRSDGGGKPEADDRGDVICGICGFGGGSWKHHQDCPRSTDETDRGDVTLLPTPTATYDGGSSEAHLARKSQTFDGSVRTSCTDLRMVVEESAKLLPTPTARDWRGQNQRLDQTCLPGLVEQAHEALHARYGPAIERHALLVGRPAPPPVFTNPRSRSGVSLSPAFVEWMQCLPVGWVTAVKGIARTNQLKALGNGVVSPQAAYAFDQLFSRLEGEQG